ncbi:hypothetical protein APY04_3095 [Hyphomicrobium sulfonivorans]|uniref:Uncharacterized protein n=1 Tax=Hyphomicrobium sulfonivorans TaxID=121290 RepID=A0A125NTX8_HYPSL|nr:hypothetical protein [Hyphomicrobium sulfonivorans]KWT64855.1 hypothetical protein APY04_3095 [Hyphomicrobium sulfonivorans]
MLQAIEAYTPPLRARPSAPRQQSPELLRFNQARSAYVDCIWAGDEARAAVASDLIDDAIVTLLERPVRSWADVLDIAEVLIAERWTADEHGLPDEQFCEGHRFNIERALLRAMLTFGGRCNG